MSKRGKIDVRKLERIPAEKVPPKVQATDWENVFSSVQKGEAILLPSELAAPSSIREALKRWQKRGRFKRLYTTTRKVGEKKYVTYVVNPSGE